MGNGVTKLTHCFPRRRRRHVTAAVTSEPYDEGLGHSFCYVSSNTTLYSISGAAVSANTSTVLSTTLPFDVDACTVSAAFESSMLFTSIPLQVSGPLDRGFLSGPIERGFMSGPLDHRPGLFSGPLDNNNNNSSSNSSNSLRRSFSHGGKAATSLLRSLSKVIRNNMVPDKLTKDHKELMMNVNVQMEESRLQWAQGKAGEDRVHVVVSEEHGWIFVGIYDGFNGPDATDFLLSNLYSSVQKELKGLLWEEEDDDDEVNGLNCEESLKQGRRWDLDGKLRGELRRSGSLVNHEEVLKALAMALKRTEEDYLEIADKVQFQNPELALMGSCVLAMVMKGEDVYLMNVGDSRAVLGHKVERGSMGKAKQDLGRISEEACGGDFIDWSPTLAAMQLTLDHSTCVEQEVRRIRKEHPEDACAVVNDRVKGSLKVTRAFGAGFLK